MSRRELTESEIEALSTVVNYCWNDEREDYLECSDTDPEANQRTGHVFEHLVTLANFLDDTNNTPMEAAEEE